MDDECSSPDKNKDRDEESVGISKESKSSKTKSPRKKSKKKKNKKDSSSKSSKKARISGLKSAEYRDGDVVWAKLWDFPWWPGKIELNGKIDNASQQSLNVRWFGDDWKNVHSVRRNRVLPFDIAQEPQLLDDEPLEEMDMQEFGIAVRRAKIASDKISQYDERIDAGWINNGSVPDRVEIANSYLPIPQAEEFYNDPIPTECLVVEQQLPPIKVATPNRFDLNNPAAYNHLATEGFVVLRNIATPSQIEIAENLLWKWLESLPFGINRDDRSTWANENWPGDAQLGIIGDYGIGQSELMWYVRSLTRMKQVFSYVWNTNELIVSLDGCNVYRPWKDKPDWKTSQHTWWHCDQNDRLPDGRGIQCVQGLVSLKDVTPESGGFCIVPKSHKMHSDMCAASHNKCGHFVPIPNLDASMKSKARLISCKAGDLVLWDSRAVHCNTCGTEGDSDEKSTTDGSTLNGKLSSSGVLISNSATSSSSSGIDLLRIACYICMVPRSKATNGVIYQRQFAFNNHITASHCPHHMIFHNSTTLMQTSVPSQPKFITLQSAARNAAVPPSQPNATSTSTSVSMAAVNTALPIAMTTSVQPKTTDDSTNSALFLPSLDLSLSTQSDNRSQRPKKRKTRDSKAEIATTHTPGMIALGGSSDSDSESSHHTDEDYLPPDAKRVKLNSGATSHSKKKRRKSSTPPLFSSTVPGAMAPDSSGRTTVAAAAAVAAVGLTMSNNNNAMADESNADFSMADIERNRMQRALRSASKRCQNEALRQTVENYRPKIFVKHEFELDLNMQQMVGTVFHIDDYTGESSLFQNQRHLDLNWGKWHLDSL